MNLFTHLRVWQILTGWIILFSYAEAAWAQCLQASFTLPDTVCIGEPVNIVNTSTGATRYEWDFCSGDLDANPSISTLAKLSIANTLTDIEIVTDGVNWFGFASSRDNNKLIRLDFGASLENTPTVDDLGNPNNMLFRPEQIKFTKEGGNWYGIVTNLGDFTKDYSVVRLNFGDKLTNIPAGEKINSLTSYLQGPRGIEIVRDGNDVIGLVTNERNNALLIIRFGSSISNNPSASDIIVTNSFSGTSSGLSGISVVRYCNQWIGMATSYNKGIYRLNFGNTLFTTPSISNISNSFTFPLGPTRIKFLYEQNSFIAFMILLNGDLIKYDFGITMTGNPKVTKISSFVGDGFGLSYVNDNSISHIYSTDFLSNTIYRYQFENKCNSSIAISNELNPSGLYYTEGGKKYVLITAYDANNNRLSYKDSLFVNPAIVPTFLISNKCVNQPTEFKSSTVASINKIVSYSWNFGDGTTVTGATVQHTFTTSKSYDVSLTVTDVCGKTTTTTQSVQIYNPSIANFTSPASICSNQPVTFIDASVVVNDSIAKWEWDFGNNTISNDKNPTYVFTQAGTQAVSLKITGKSGCQTNILKSVSIKEGPMVGFAVEQTCLGVQTRFKDETILGNGTAFVSRSWDFGDNATSTESNPIHSYAQAGTYLVKLTVQNNVGCSVTLTKSIIIRRLPKAAFSTALACAGEGTPFTDASTSADGAITQWEWNFGEPTSSTNVSTSANPIHIFEKPGTYQVKLKVTTTFGCVDSVTQAITVLSAPKAGFTFQSSCTNREVIFTDASQASGTSIIGYYWDFGDNSTPSTEKSPKHTYTREGAYTVQLTVTSSTRCTNTIQKTIAAGGIAVTFSPDTSICAEKTVTFRPQVVTPNDPVKSWQWDFGTLGNFTTEAPAVTIPASLTALTVSLTVTTNSGCSTTTTKTIPVRPSAIAQFSYQSAPSQPLQITFVNQSTGASRYTWDFGDNTQSTSASPVHTYAKGGIYTITLTALHPNGCESVKSILMPLEVANINQVTIFPNPFTADQTVTLAFMLPRKQPVSLEIIDLTGRTLQKAVIENTIDGLNNPALSQVLPIVSSLGKGMYVITLRYGNTFQLQKVIVQ